MADEDLELLFGQAPIGDMPLDLVFGDDDSVVIPPVLVNGGARITGIRRSVSARLGARLFSNLKITGMRQPVGVYYDVNVDRPMVSRVTTSAQQGLPVDVPVSFHFEDGSAYFTGVRTFWTAALGLSSETNVRFEEGARSRQRLATRFVEAVRLGTLPYELLFEDGIRQPVGLRTRFEEARRVSSTPVRLLFQDGIRLRRDLLSSWDAAKPLMAPLHTRFTPAMPLDRWLRYPFQEAWPPRPGSRAIVPPEPHACYVPGLPIDLVFDEVSDDGSSPVHLVFVCGERTPEEPGAVIVVPIRRTYVTINSITLHRVDTGAELRAHGFDMSLDEGSWTWAWSASLDHDASGHLGRDAQGDPAEVLAVVNGIQFRLRLENVSRDRRFNPTRWAVSGRGRAAILSNPYAPNMSFGNPTAARTAQQLMADVLTINGVSNGWAVQWALEDWVVPAGVWAFNGSYIDAINDIAGSVGGYVQPHATDATLRVLPRYPTKPWAWGDVTPDFQIPDHVAEVEGTEYIDKPGYNRVFVGGINAGVFGPFKRTGTAGDVLAPQVNHALITSEVAHRQRGLAVLSDTGRQEHVTITMPVLPETGVIVPGQFVRYQADKTYIGLVRSTRLNWQRPTLRQALRIETHA